MKRYLMSYSKRDLTVRDRLTNQVKIFKNIDSDTAEEFINKIKDVNYTIPNEKSNIKVYTNFNLANNNFKPEYGWIKPQNIKWYKEQTLSNDTTEKIKTLEQKLDELLTE